MMRNAFLIMVLVFAMTLSYPNAQPTDPQACMDAFKGTSKDCRDRLSGLLHFHFRFGGLKKTCCGSVANVTDVCWPVIFPSMPYIRFIVKYVCT
ncbi:unnamed protein product [Eruca vesicaria subsp. sativa]|uniref:Prolamin-like domain-containing protein n=1 Tax=Eruca vesicaria subsp. sativa TaxID=29727 RepID=A0ABC8M4U7_ERUVS|nr:unnamed protein product [Eruca vesicaria subsp. sativa]